MESEINEVAGDNMATLSEVMNRAIKEGYSQIFDAGISKGRNIISFEQGEDTIAYHPEDVVIVSFYRFEGQSDPGDNAILYLIETNDGVKGTLVDGYGPTAEKWVSQFVLEVEEIYKEKMKNL